VPALRTCCIGSRRRRFEIALTLEDAAQNRASLCEESVCSASSPVGSTIVVHQGIFGRCRRVAHVHCQLDTIVGIAAKLAWAVVLTLRSDVPDLTFAEPWCSGVSHTALPCVMLGFGSLGCLVVVGPPATVHHPFGAAMCGRCASHSRRCRPSPRTQDGRGNQAVQGSPVQGVPCRLERKACLRCLPRPDPVLSLNVVSTPAKCGGPFSCRRHGRPNGLVRPLIAPVMGGGSKPTHSGGY
jgi:hypothetical protein